MSNKSAAAQLAKILAQNEIPSGDRLIKALVGKTNLSSGWGLLPYVLSTRWYCIALTNKHLLLISLSALWKTVGVEQFEFSEITDVLFKTGKVTDEFKLNIGEDRSLSLQVSRAFRDQSEAISTTLCSGNSTV